jgi:FAD/FMN-containing dehydrogenase
MRRDTRRQVLKRIAATAIFAPALFAGRPARAAPPLPDLPESDALLLRPGDAHFTDYQAAFNARTMLTPQLRALCKTAGAVGVMVDWCRSNNLPFALRSGGHCYEGFSQSESVVIDTRLINKITIDRATKTATAGAGASLGEVYKAIAPHGLALPAGSCPTVGISGHVLGGGYGYLARPYGLACDSVLAVDLIDPQGRQIHADARQNADLLWACRGGGGGSFGAVTGFRFQLHAVRNVLVFQIDWPPLTPERAAAVMKTWQAWAPHAPSAIDANLVIGRHTGGSINLRCSGQSIGTLTALRRELKALSNAAHIEQKTYMSAVDYFSGGWTYTSAPMKGKSDYANAPLSDAGLAALMDEVSRKTNIYVICDAYGGAIAGTAPDATAFAHRGGTLFCLQYGSDWTHPNDTPQLLDDMRELYAAMRPYVSGAAYVNYCDEELTDWTSAYWGPNLARLRQVKAAFDPDNVFRHAQSVPTVLNNADHTDAGDAPPLGHPLGIRSPDASAFGLLISLVPETILATNPREIAYARSHQRALARAGRNQECGLRRLEAA